MYKTYLRHDQCVSVVEQEDLGQRCSPGAREEQDGAL